MCNDCENLVDVRVVMDAVLDDAPLEEKERQLVVASLMLWLMTPAHTRDALMEDFIAAAQYDLSPATSTIN